jgi:hypothetical protein
VLRVTPAHPEHGAVLATRTMKHGAISKGVDDSAARSSGCALTGLDAVLAVRDTVNAQRCEKRGCAASQVSTATLGILGEGLCAGSFRGRRSFLLLQPRSISMGGLASSFFVSRSDESFSPGSESDRPRLRTRCRSPARPRKYFVEVACVSELIVVRHFGAHSDALKQVDVEADLGSRHKPVLYARAIHTAEFGGEERLGYGARVAEVITSSTRPFINCV